MLATTWSAVVDGGRPSLIRVEVLVSPGLPSFSIVGAAESACREARDRVRAAVLSSGLAWPMRRITAGLAPSWITKRGSGTDLALGVGVLAAAGVVPGSALGELCFVGELGLDGRVRAVPATAALASVAGGRRLVVAAEAERASALVSDGHVSGVRTLSEVVRCLEGVEPWPDATVPGPSSRDRAHDPRQAFAAAGLAWVDWAPSLAVGAAGGHSAVTVAPLGAGRVVVRALWECLPDLDREGARSVLVRAAGSELEHSGVGDPWRPPLVVLGLADARAGRRREGVGRAVAEAAGGLLLVELSAASTRWVRELDLCLAKASAWGATVGSDGGGALPGLGNGLGSPVAAPQLVLSGAPGACQALSRSAVEGLSKHVEIALVGQVPSGMAGWLSSEPSAALLSRRVEAARRRSVERWGVPVSQVPPVLLQRDAPLGSLERAQLRAFVEHAGGDEESGWAVHRVARTVADLAGESTISSDHLQSAAELWAEGRRWWR